MGRPEREILSLFSSTNQLTVYLDHRDCSNLVYYDLYDLDRQRDQPISAQFLDVMLET